MVSALKELNNFSQENPGAFYEDYVKSFGPPDYFAKVLLEDLDPEVLNYYRKQRKSLVFISAIAGITGVVLILSLTSAYWHSQYRTERRFNEGAPIVIGPAVQLTEEETEEFWAAHPESDTNWSIDNEN